ncbi:tetratricopeptide repeat protein [bacterium]|nr:tetratricopeptide repeat protein [candidate division CSSED10-310 bacterium]
MRTVVAVWFAVMLAWPVAGNSMQALFEKGNAAYDQGDYEAALGSYQAIIEQDIHNGSVFYNAGNACFQLGRLGEAILYYERAARLLPRDEDVRINLQLARDLTRDVIETPPTGWFTKAIGVLYYNFTPRELAVAVMACYLVAALAFITSLLTLHKRRRRALTRTGMVLLIPVAFVGLSLAAMLYNNHYHPQGIVMVDEVEARSGPGADFTSLFTVHEGTRLFVRGSRGDWCQVMLPNGMSGLLPAAAVQVI